MDTYSNNLRSNETRTPATIATNKITEVCDAIKEVLLEKNRRYGNSALCPLNIFSKNSSDTSILIRIDDKIARIKNASEIRKNDVFDLIGYLTLYAVQQNWDFNDLVD